MSKYTLLLTVLTLIFVVGKGQTKMPPWASQDINHEAARNIIPCPGMKIITVGDTYTATFEISGMLWYKQNLEEKGVYFSPDVPQWDRDSCKLKEDLRPFIKLQMTKYFVANSKK